MAFDFEQILALSPNPYVIVDADLVIVWMNDAYLATTMRTREEITGREMFEAFPSDPASDSHQLLSQSLRRVIETGRVDEIALIRYDIQGRDGQQDVRYWSATHTPLFEDGDLKFILQHTVDVTELQELRTAREQVGVMRRASAVQQRNRTLAQESRRMMDFFDQAPAFTAILAGSEHRFEMSNQAYRRLVGRTELFGKTVGEAMPELIDQGFIEILDDVRATGRPYFGRREEVLLLSSDGSAVQPRFLDFIFQPIFDTEERVTGIMVQGYDVTHEVEAQERQELLLHELNHRVKNSLAIVQGLALQSFKSMESRDERAVFEARLRTLAAAHNLLTEGSWGAAGVGEIVAKSVGATLGEASGRVTFAGPQVYLPPQTAVALAMVIHELSTNALKYGALSNSTGSIRVNWAILPGEPRRFRMEWKESGGPTVGQPERTGFGTRLISRGISDRSDGSATLSFEPDGIRCVLEKAMEQA